jgi:hypothetical protein
VSEVNINLLFGFESLSYLLVEIRNYMNITQISSRYHIKMSK